LDFQKKVWHALESDAIFAPLRVTPPIEEQKHRAAIQLRRLADLRLVPDEVLKANYKAKVSVNKHINHGLL